MVVEIAEGLVPSIAIIGGGPSGLSLAALLEAYGVKDYVVYERSDRETKPRGACLDLHPGSGQKVFKEIGAFDELRKVGRWGEETIHYICNTKLDRLFEFGEGRDAPEVDRYDIRRILLGVIPDEKVRWRCGVESSKRDENGQIVLKLTNGRSVSGFKLIIGADGAYSQIRHLVSRNCKL
jgi:2-polyprenyl-6-methoxyphenol hydroxylase-like FAD-dependent oxidoreductase